MPTSVSKATAGHDRTIRTLDGWRAIAVIAVILSHGIPRETPLRYLRPLGPHGVIIFFGISGYLIATKLLQEQATDGRIDLSAFYWRRVFRILPPAMLMLTVVVLLGAVGVLQPISPLQWSSCVFFFQNYLGEFADRRPYTGHFWSLAVEEHFYLVFPLLLATLGPRRLRTAAIALCAGAIGWRWFDDRVHLVQRWFPGSHPEHRTDYCFDLLLCGVLLALLLRESSVRAWLRERLTTPVWLAMSALFVVNVFMPVPLVGRTLEGILVALLLAGTVLRPQGLPGRVLEWPVLQFIGRISYSVYLWQQLFFVAAYRIPAWPQQFPLNVLLCLACAYASYRWIELPLVAVGRAFIERRKLGGLAPAMRPGA